MRHARAIGGILITSALLAGCAGLGAGVGAKAAPRDLSACNERNRNPQTVIDTCSRVLAVEAIDPAVRLDSLNARGVA